ncbi:MAG: glycoside hydrolase family 125 protein [Schleiferilactobacillus harbinensis]
MTSYVTPAVQGFVDQVRILCGRSHADWADIFARTFTDTLANAMKPDGPDRIFVLTGDIPAMWQRDTTAQIRPYLVLAQTDTGMADIISRVVQRLFFNMDHDPYANAFNLKANYAGHQSDATTMTPWIWERKYELDSLCYPVQLAYLLWRNTGRTDHFDAQFQAAIKKMIHVIRTEQHHETSPYRFERTEDRPEDTLIDGVGRPVGYTGMSWSGFRPSDDACVYGYLVPANMFAVVVLRQLADIYTDVLKDTASAADFLQLAQEIQDGIDQYGTVKNAAGETIYAYEVDGLGNALVMDDGNVPNLLSAPYLGYVEASDTVYQDTRRTILSPENPYYYKGRVGGGLGSPHTPPHYIWPIALAMEGLTTADRTEKAAYLDLLTRTTGGTGMMHESFQVNDPTQYTREWFSWANMMFCELVMDYVDLRVRQ